MEAAVERLAALGLGITCLSHILAPRQWAIFFLRMRETGEVAGFHNGFVHMPLGLIIVAFHPVWTWPGLLTTIVGLGLTLKGLLAFTVPALTRRSLAHVSLESAWKFRIAGFLMLPLALAIGWYAPWPLP